MFKRALASSFVALLIATPTLAQTGTGSAPAGKTEPPAGTTAPAPKGTPRSDSQLIVGLKPGVTDEQAAALWKAVNVKVVEKVQSLPSYVVAVAPGRIAKVEADLKARPEVEYVERNVKHAPAPKK